MNKEDFNEILSSVEGIRPLRRNSGFHPVEDRELLQIEKELQSTLPEDYRKFLGCIGGASFNRLMSFRPITKLPGMDSGPETSPFSIFYGGAADEKDSVLFHWMAYRSQKRIPADLVPIGDNLFGDQICLAHAGPDRGKVFFWDHDDERSEYDYWERYGPNVPVPRKFLYGNIYLVALSFVDFLNRLVVAT